MPVYGIQKGKKGLKATMKSKKFYSLNPEFYQELWEGSLKNSENFKKKSLENQTLKTKHFEHKLKKALSGWHTALLFDSAFLQNPCLDSYIQKCIDGKITPALQISPVSLSRWQKRLKALRQSYPQLEIHFFCQDFPPLEDLKALSPNIFLVYVITKRNYKSFLTPLAPLVRGEICPDYHFHGTENYRRGQSKSFCGKNGIFGDNKGVQKSWLYFPYKTRFWDSFLSPSQIYRFIQKSPTTLAPYPVDIYDPRIPLDTDLEPLIKPFASNLLPHSTIDFSVIIPSYNNETLIIRTLKALAQQNYPRNRYELIVVDDGSLDNSRTQIKNFIQDHPSLNIQGIQLPRVIEKQKNTAGFRAGLARNLGVKHSSGKYLLFLDSDILIPPNQLSQLKQEHQNADVILCPRQHLRSSAPLEQVFFKDISQHCYIENQSYWAPFYKKGFDKVSCPWKYICTYTLSLSKKDFLEVGGFGKTFLFYGFEDVDLGYRLFKKNKKFYLSRQVVYHQSLTNKSLKSSFFKKPLLKTRSDFLFKQRQLSKTAKIFFQRHLDPSIYKELFNYMRGYHS